MGGCVSGLGHGTYVIFGALWRFFKKKACLKNVSETRGSARNLAPYP